MSTLVDYFHRRWVCGVVRSGFHNGSGCSPDEAHGGDWGCGWRWEASIPATPQVDAEFNAALDVQRVAVIPAGHTATGSRRGLVGGYRDALPHVADLGARFGGLAGVGVRESHVENVLLWAVLASPTPSENAPAPNPTERGGDGGGGQLPSAGSERLAESLKLVGELRTPAIENDQGGGRLDDLLNGGHGSVDAPARRSNDSTHRVAPSAEGSEVTTTRDMTSIPSPSSGVAPTPPEAPEPALCSGSGGYPTKWPGWGEHQKAPCSVCGAVVTVYLRRYDHNRMPRDLVVSNHPTGGAASPTPTTPCDCTYPGTEIAGRCGRCGGLRAAPTPTEDHDAR